MIGIGKFHFSITLIITFAFGSSLEYALPPLGEPKPFCFIFHKYALPPLGKPKSSIIFIYKYALPPLGELK